LVLLGVPPLGGYNYITPRHAGLSATAGLFLLSQVSIGKKHSLYLINFKTTEEPSTMGIEKTNVFQL